jgi:predicted Zn-dependent peptidase
MEHKKITKPGYNLYLIPTSKFSTNILNVKLIIPAEKEEITLLNVLIQYMYRANNKYKNIRELAIESENNCIINFNNNLEVYASNFVLNHAITFLNMEYTSLETFNNTINFSMNSIFNVSFEDNNYNQEQLSVILNKVKADIAKEKDDRRAYSTIKFLETFLPNEPISYKQEGYIEDLEKINLISLKEYYNHLINNAQLDIFITGNHDEDSLISNVDKWVLNRENKEHSFKIVNNHTKKELVLASESLPSNQSYMHLGFKIDEMTKFEANAVLPILADIYGGGGNSLLFENVREKNSLCYIVGARDNRFYRFIHVYSGINANNYNKAKDLILSLLNNIKEGNYEESMIDDVKKTILNEYKSINDSKEELVYYLQLYLYLDKVSIEEKIELINKVTKEDIAKLVDKINLDSIYFLEGVAE